MNMILILKLAAVAHLGLIAAGLLMPQATGLWAETERLSPFGRGLFRTYYAFIGLCLVSFGLGSWIFAPELVSGTPLARALCGFLAVFWTIRLVAAVWVLDVKPYLTNGWWRLGYAATNVVFGLMPFCYAWAAIRS
ncbi:MAG TPA: hypothetical protein VHD32_13720 [Candidatus Didemnitutus sp.]|nr:hypothetical protein [Candidatus Didemnitutus sp.]